MGLNHYSLAVYQNQEGEDGGVLHVKEQLHSGQDHSLQVLAPGERVFPLRIGQEHPEIN